jgi:Plasmid pRiA4b ORF-3-like protein
MKPLRKHAGSADSSATPVADADEIVQIKLWLLGISPMVWRRVLVPASYTLRELHGMFQVAMGWEGIHLFQFSLRAVFYGSAGTSSPDITLAALRLRKGARFLYEYDLNIPWRHELASKPRWCGRRIRVVRIYSLATVDAHAMPMWHHKSVIALFQIVLRLLIDLIALIALGFRQRRATAAEILVLRRQIALYKERGIKPRRIDPVTRISGVTVTIL